ncbi:helix-turn-helix domain-containing protein, partial [Pseudomonadota bacterium]
PGNVRELENILERALTLCEDNTIQLDDLQLPKTNQQAPSHDNKALDSYLDSHERDAIQKALEQTKYNKTAAAKVLGITFRQLRYRLKKLGID